MKRPRTQEIKEAFLRLAEADPAERQGLLATRHGGDPELRRAVESMLHTSRELPDGFLEPPPEVAEAARRAREQSGRQQPDGNQDPEGSAASRVEAGVSGQRIGRYQLVRHLGEGGFGVVWEAEQREPMHRLVALKLIKRGMDTEQVIARFAAEQQVLALMDHPGIARVLDAGCTDDGRPYFVMDLVVGTPIVQFCRERALSTDGRLRLFESACRAIHHAHQRGIVHRDIKPSNLLVTECDGEARPKIIDFGIAKAVGSAAAPSSRVTQQRQLVGTPAYMAPEQTMSGDGDVDARSDIYSLGVLLYELLTGTTPFDGGGATTAKFDTIARRIREEPPQKPSRRLPKHEKLAGELDWITLKCLEKEKARRYASAVELADDIRRHLEHQPVVAGPPDAIYRLRKFCRRHRLVVAGAVALAGVLFVVASVGFFWTAWKNRQLDTANAELRQSNRQYLREKSVAERALLEVERLSDSDVLARLMVRAERDLWPAVPERIDSMERWLAEALQVADRAAVHRAELDAVRARALPPDEIGFASEPRLQQTMLGAHRSRPRYREDGSEADAEPDAPDASTTAGARAEAQSWSFATTKDAWLHGLLAALVQRLDAFTAPDTGTIASVQRRVAFARELAARLTGEDAAVWRETIADIEHGDRYPVLRDTGFQPQVGIVPLGRDPASGLHEFLDLATHAGPIPQRDDEGRLRLGELTGAVLVLIPGGRFLMGAQEDDEQAPNFDTLAVRNELPVHEVTIAPFLLGKHELTQAQWMRLERGENPSYFYYGLRINGQIVTRRHPVEQVEWSDGRRVLRKAGLRYPDEAEWEYAARAGSGKPWFFGDRLHDLPRFANFADISSRQVVMRVSNLDDGHPFTAPVGSYGANSFGLHDVYGNVSEWCRDLFRPSYELGEPLQEPLRTNDSRDPRRRAVRGGDWASLPNQVRSGHREFVRGTTILSGLGLRPVRDIHRR